MMSDSRSTDRQISGNMGVHWVRQGVSLVIFLVLAAVGMLATYVYFSPGTLDVEAISNIDSEGQFSLVDPNAQLAPIFKQVEAKPVTQRLNQSPPPLLIGIIAGHRGNDSGTECPDGLTEVEITSSLTDKLIGRLMESGINAEDLDEFDSRLDNFSATALISVHVDSCDFINDLATGFKIAGSPYTDSSDLSICMQQAYADATSLPYHASSVTPHMANYHAFRKIGKGTPALIIEVGFLNLDREILTEGSDIVLDGLVGGIQCFLDQTR
jgi:N-acetylmuramoyl-L-alanine amidase